MMKKPALALIAIALGDSVFVGVLAFIMAGHVRHNMGVLRLRYQIGRKN